jgi:hypothetical protein
MYIYIIFVATFITETEQSLLNATQEHVLSSPCLERFLQTAFQTKCPNIYCEFCYVLFLCTYLAVEHSAA